MLSNCLYLSNSVCFGQERFLPVILSLILFVSDSNAVMLPSCLSQSSSVCFGQERFLPVILSLILFVSDRKNASFLLLSVLSCLFRIVMLPSCLSLPNSDCVDAGRDILLASALRLTTGHLLPPVEVKRLFQGQLSYFVISADRSPILNISVHVSQ